MNPLQPTPQASTLRFHANAETDNALAKAIATAPHQIPDTLQELHIPPLAWMFEMIYRLDRAQYLQDALDGGRKARAGRSGAGRAKPLSAAERRGLRAEIRALRNDAQLPKLPSRFPLCLLARRTAALQEIYRRYQYIVRQTEWQAGGQKCASPSFITQAHQNEPFSQARKGAR